jgi:hypothetical protein
MGHRPTGAQSARDRCFACSGAISRGDFAVYLYGAWFHLDCYERENNFPTEPRAVPAHRRPEAEPAWPIKRLIAWITDTSPRVPSMRLPSMNDPVPVGGGRVRATRRAPRARWAATKA